MKTPEQEFAATKKELMYIVEAFLECPYDTSGSQVFSPYDIKVAAENVYLAHLNVLRQCTDCEEFLNPEFFDNSSRCEYCESHDPPRSKQ